MKRISALAFILALLSQSSCIVAGGYRGSNGGWYIWPGSFLSILVIIVVVFLLLKRRR